MMNVGLLRGKRWLFLPINLVAMAICIGAAIAAAAERLDSTPQEVFDSMRRSFQAAKAKGVHARYQWELSGPQGGQWWIDVDDGEYKMGKGKIANPNVTFVARDKDWVAVSNRQLGGIWAYMTGRLKIRGDQGLARKLGQIFSPKPRVYLDLHEGCGPRFGARFSPKEIEVAFEGAASACAEFKGFEASVAHLQPGPVFAVLNNGVLDLQLPLGSYDIVGAVTFVKETTECAEFPIVSWIINQGRFWEDAFETKFIGEEPDNAAAGRHDRTLVK